MRSVAVAAVLAVVTSGCGFIASRSGVDVVTTSDSASVGVVTEHEPSPPASSQTGEPTVSPSVGDPEDQVVITETDSGRRFVFDVDTDATLRLSGGWRWSEPQVDGDAITLSRVRYESDPGFDEWSITVLGAGTAIITSSGEPECRPACGAPSLAFQVTIEVT